MTNKLKKKSISKKIVVINSHPIQYYAPLYQYLTEIGLNIEVLYLSNYGLNPTFDKEFGTIYQWDIPLLDGYNYIFLKNYAVKANISFWGLLNLGILKEVYKLPPKSIIWVHGWQYLPNILSIFFGKIFGHKVLLRTDSNIKDELAKIHKLSKYKALLKKIILKLLFSFVDSFLVVGKRNSEFFSYYGIENEKKIYTPFSVDNQRFFDFDTNNRQNKNLIKRAIGIPENKVVIISSGKLISIKRHIDILKAIKQINSDDLFLMIVGDGSERNKLETFALENKIKNFKITGFINQSEIPKYYIVSDIYVMSSEKEAWGLSTNEAMCFNLPIILSDVVGSVDDLVTPNNGLVYPCGNIEKLAQAILEVKIKYVDNPTQCKSKEIIDKYSFKNIAVTIADLCK